MSSSIQALQAVRDLLNDVCADLSRERWPNSKEYNHDEFLFSEQTKEASNAIARLQQLLQK